MNQRKREKLFRQFAISDFVLGVFVAWDGLEVPLGENAIGFASAL